VTTLECILASPATAWAERAGELADYLGRHDLLDLGLEERTVARLLRQTPHSGHDGALVVETAQLPDGLAMLGGCVREGRRL
jgi:hypothetical protein